MIRGQIDEMFASARPLGEVIEETARLGAQLLLQLALEAEVEEFLGRARYERTAGGAGVREGFRNGYSPVTVKTTVGPVVLSRPKVRGTTEKFTSRLFGARVCRSNALETLVIASFVRGLSTRDVEATLEEVLGQDGTVSRSTVSRICEQITAEYQACHRSRNSPRGRATEFPHLWVSGGHVSRSWWGVVGCGTRVC